MQNTFSTLVPKRGKVFAQTRSTNIQWASKFWGWRSVSHSSTMNFDKTCMSRDVRGCVLQHVLHDLWNKWTKWQVDLDKLVKLVIWFSYNCANMTVDQKLSTNCVWNFWWEVVWFFSFGLSSLSFGDLTIYWLTSTSLNVCIDSVYIDWIKSIPSQPAFDIARALKN